LMIAKYGKPDVITTEFVSAEGICHGATKPLSALIYNEIERPILAQVFGSDPQSFYKSAFVFCELGFDGIDINMGCPAKNITAKGSGASLIQTPELAKKITRETMRGVSDWAKGKKIKDSGLPDTIIDYLNLHRPKMVKRKVLPVSIKTRIGYNRDCAEEWVKHLLESKPANISIHGRTLKQMYTGKADWNAIGHAAEVARGTETTILGNGDIESIEDGLAKVKEYGVDGFLIGRAAFGNPWIFQVKGPEIMLRDRIKAAIKHSELYEEIFGNKHFVHMRKHLAWYLKGFPGAGEIRKKLMQTSSAQEVKEVLQYAHESDKGT
ncbi:tRNA-dihydrouridine synthase, partial [Patescibacteria group bacterium]|nr:tRNA-dihydrouridine synthase [Patescibacteria group bacterium]MBU1703175.1 tRNA-dihydrouridine synthase [Patescibacteria group bacterium]